MFLSPVDDQEIIRMVQNCKNKKSTDYSDINMSLIKNVITEIVQPFGHICNVSFQTGVFPSKIKLPKLFHFLSAVKRMYLQITGQYHCYLNSRKFLRNYIIIG